MQIMTKLILPKPKVSDIEPNNNATRSEHTTSVAPPPASLQGVGTQPVIRKEVPTKIPPRSVQHTRFGISKTVSATVKPVVEPRKVGLPGDRDLASETKLPEMSTPNLGTKLMCSSQRQCNRDF
jgi:hypothetical protein